MTLYETIHCAGYALAEIFPSSGGTTVAATVTVRDAAAARSGGAAVTSGGVRTAGTAARHSYAVSLLGEFAALCSFLFLDVKDLRYVLAEASAAVVTTVAVALFRLLLLLMLLLTIFFPDVMV